MRKFTKFAVITALVMMVTGGILTAGGILFGASPKAFLEGLERGTKHNYVFNRWFGPGLWERISDWEDYWDGNSGQWYEDWVDDWYEDSENGVYHMDWSEENQKASIDASEVESLYVSVEAGKIQIQPSPDEKIWISGLKPQYYIADIDEQGELYISRSGPLGNNDNVLLIQVPENKVFTELSLSSSAGGLEAQGRLSAESCDIEVEAGSLEAELLEADYSDLDCSAGRLQVKYTGKLEDYNAEVHMDAGALELDGKQLNGFQDGTFGTLSGEKTIEANGSAGKMVIDFENK